MIRVLVIGSKGSIGQHVFRFISSSPGFECWGADVVTDYQAVRYFLVDSTNSNYSELFQQQAFDYCINCSGAASVPYSLEEPLKDYQLNVANVYKMLESIRRYRPSCRFVNLSSAAVYGNPSVLPVPEGSGLAPISPYGVHKMQAEQVCDLFYRYWQIGTCSLRIFSAYGEGLTKQLFWDLYQKSLKSDIAELFGTGDETRDFIHFEDISRAIMLVIKNAGFKGECINVANGRQHSVREAATIFYDALGWQGKLSFKGAARTGDPIHWEADISMLKGLGYNQGVDLKKGLVRYASWLKERK